MNICRALIEELNGQILLEEQPLNAEGCTFIIEFPCELGKPNEASIFSEASIDLLADNPEDARTIEDE